MGQNPMPVIILIVVLVGVFLVIRYGVNTAANKANDAISNKWSRYKNATNPQGRELLADRYRGVANLGIALPPPGTPVPQPGRRAQPARARAVPAEQASAAMRPANPAPAATRPATQGAPAATTATAAPVAPAAATPVAPAKPSSSAPKRMFCPKCGKELSPGAKFCGSCGTPIHGS